MDKSFKLLTDVWGMITVGAGAVGYGLYGDFQHTVLFAGVSVVSFVFPFLTYAYFSYMTVPENENENENERS